MDYSIYKITDQEAGTVGVQSAPGVLSKTPQENKAVFDALPELVRKRYNALVDELAKEGQNPILGQEGLWLRVNDENEKMEFSLDGGATWQQSANEGHRVMDNDGVIFPQKSDLQFKGANVTDEDGRTVVQFFPNGEGVPEGGDAGQILQKRSDASFDTEWSNTAADAAKLGGVVASDYMRVSTFADPENPNAVLQATNATNHIARNDNPHGVSKAQVGLSNVANVAALPLAGGTMGGDIQMQDKVIRFWKSGYPNQFYIGGSYSGIEGAAGVFYSMGTGRIYLGANAGVWANTETGGVGSAIMYAADFTKISARRFKKNIQTMVVDKAKDLISRLRPVEFDYIEKDKHSLGFIAEEILDVCPEAVQYAKDEDGTEQIFGLSYDTLIAPMVALLQDQQKQIDDLTARIETLEKEREDNHDTI